MAIYCYLWFLKLSDVSLLSISIVCAHKNKIMSLRLIIEVHWDSFLNNFGKLIKLIGQFVDFQVIINN